MARPGLHINPKFLRLVHVLQEPVPHVRGYLECLWEVAYECGDPRLGDWLGVELAAKYPEATEVTTRRNLPCRFLLTGEQESGKNVARCIERRVASRLVQSRQGHIPELSPPPGEGMAPGRVGFAREKEIPKKIGSPFG